MCHGSSARPLSTICIVSLKSFMAHVQREEETAHFTYGEEVLHCLILLLLKNANIMRNIKQHACGERHSSETGKSSCSLFQGQNIWS